MMPSSALNRIVWDRSRAGRLSSSSSALFASPIVLLLRKQPELGLSATPRRVGVSRNRTALRVDQARSGACKSRQTVALLDHLDRSRRVGRLLRQDVAYGQAEAQGARVRRHDQS